MARPLEGVWDLIMLPGYKQQGGESYLFNEANLVGVVRNFERTYSRRRLTMDDGNHIATVPVEQAPRAVQELAQYSGLAAIWDGRVVAHWDHFPDAPPPDPQALLRDVQQDFPRVDSVDGLWGFRRKATDLGKQMLPNLHQISPWFGKGDKDEAGNDVPGYTLLNVSPVFVAHQNGSVLFGRMGLSSSGLHAPRPQGEKMDEQALYAKLGSAPGCAPEEMKKAFAKYMAESDDPPAERQKVAAAMAKLGDLEIVHKEGEATAAQGKMGEESPEAVLSAFATRFAGLTDEERAAEMAAMAVDPSNWAQNAAVHIKTGNSHDGKGDTKIDPKRLSKMGASPAVVHALQRRLTEETEERGKMAKRLEALEAEKRASDRAAFARKMTQGDGAEPPRFTAEKDALTFLDEHAGDVAKAAAMAKKYLPAVGVFRRFTEGGNPSGASSVTGADKGVEFRKLTDEIYNTDPECKRIEGHTARFGRAQQIAAARRPDLYR